MNIAIAVALGLAIFSTAIWVVRALATPPPPELDPDEVVEVAADYQCSVCGMQLTVTRAQGADHAAPRHCREEMAEI